MMGRASVWGICLAVAIGTWTGCSSAGSAEGEDVSVGEESGGSDEDADVAGGEGDSGDGSDGGLDGEIGRASVGKECRWWWLPTCSRPTTRTEHCAVEAGCIRS